MRVKDTVGVVYEEGDDVCVADEFDGSVRLEARLAPFEGAEITLIAHHYPFDPPDLTRPGGGSCLHHEGCPYGHDENPNDLYTFTAKGRLRRLGKQWVVEKGGEHKALEVEMLVGHRSQILILQESVQESKDIEERVEAAQDLDLDSASIDELIQRGKDVKGLLEELRSFAKDV